MVLSDKAIIQAIAQGHIVCDPPPKRIEGTSIDVRLGEHFWFPYHLDAGTVIRVNGDPRDLWYYYHAEGWVHIPPHTKVLAHTVEFIGSTVGTIVPQMRCRSTTNRWGITVAQCAGWGDCGYVSRWTMEVKNDLDFTVAIPIGARVAQIIFQRVEGEAPLYAKHYNAQKDEWTPQHMLPKAIDDDR